MLINDDNDMKCPGSWKYSHWRACYGIIICMHRSRIHITTDWERTTWTSWFNFPRVFNVVTRREWLFTSYSQNLKGFSLVCCAYNLFVFSCHELADACTGLVVSLWVVLVRKEIVPVKWWTLKHWKSWKDTRSTIGAK